MGFAVIIVSNNEASNKKQIVIKQFFDSCSYSYRILAILILNISIKGLKSDLADIWYFIFI